MEPLYQINVKTPRGSLLNIRASSDMELDQALDGLSVRINAIADLEQSIEAICALADAGLKPTVISTQPSAPVAVAPITAAPVAPAAGGVGCDCGIPMRLVPAGISKAGKPYKAFYACAKPREQACQKKVSA
jgi:hypothetical protein